MPLVPSYIKKLASYKPGANIDDIKKEKSLINVIKLASNENSMGPSPMAVSAINKSINKINRYPDAPGKKLRKKLASKFNVKSENVIIGSGSEGIMSNILRTFLLTDDEIIGAANSFIGFRVLATATGRKINWVNMKNHKIDLNEIIRNINDYTKLTIQTRLNGKVMQDAKLSQLIFDIPSLISYISKAIPWRAGDVLVTGTPGGVGFKRKPPIFMKDGDKVEVEISEIGVLSNIIKDEIS